MGGQTAQTTMSYFIAKSITITPQKIQYVGCDSNIYPHYDGRFEQDLTWENLRNLVCDLAGYCIEPEQTWWKETRDVLQVLFDYKEIVLDDDKAQGAMEWLIEEYNKRIKSNYERLHKEHPELKLQLLTIPKS